MTFYIVKKMLKLNILILPYWYDQLGSFNRSHIANHLNGILDPYIDEVELQGISLDNLLFKYSIFSIDLLHIDTEGYDWEILKQLGLTKYFLGL
ncbi:MAG: FkbM family methyltransferase [Saprospiraceae bacterium]|nr:FkbM family methyltransferase [Saprospiraceae bacterium]